MSKKRIIASSVLSLAMCASVITGATFALFTSEDATNIAVTSGKVAVEATMENLALYSPAKIDEKGNVVDETNVASKTNFFNGGYAAIEGAELTLSAMTPGDKATFQIKIANGSNVATKYRTAIMLTNDEGLFDGLTVDIGGTFDGTTTYSNWTDLSVDTKETTINCSVELPAKSGNVYQDATCSISFSVRAVQSNTDVTNDVVKVYNTKDGSDEIGYESLEAAVAAVKENQTIEFLRPGTYAPFKITKDNVTVMGIVGDSKAESTVIKNTATSNIQVKSDNVVLDNLYIDSSVKTQIDWLNSGAVSLYESSDAGWPVENVTIKNCHIVSNSNDNAIIYNGKNINFIDNVVENAAIALYYSASKGENHVVTGNTFKNIGTEAIIYNPEGGNGGLTLTINNNAFVGAKTQFSISDYVNTAYKNIEIKNNTGNVVYVLNMFNMKDVETPYDVVPLPGQELVSMTKVAFSGINFADYTIKNVDGTKMFHWNETTPSAETWLANGDYFLMNNKTGIKYLFSVTEPKVGVQQLVKLDTVGLQTAEDMFAFANDVNNNNNNYTGVTVQLLNDIDLNNAAWTPIGQTGATQFNGTFDGNGKTISNLSIDTTDRTAKADSEYSTGLFGWLNASTVKNLTVNGATVSAARRVGVIAGYLELGSTVESCTVKNAKLESKHITLENMEYGDGEGPTDHYNCGDKAGAVVGYMNGNCAVIDCKAENCKIYAGRDAGQIVGAGYVTKVKGCSVTNVTVESNTTECKGGNINATLVGRSLDPKVVEVDGQSYITFDEAFQEYAESGTNTLTLTGDVTFSVTSPSWSGKTDMTIDLNGHTLTLEKSLTVPGTFNGGNSLTIKDSSGGNGKVVFLNDSYIEFGNDYADTLTIEGGKFIKESGTNAIFRDSSWTTSVQNVLNLNGGDFTGVTSCDVYNASDNNVVNDNR